MSSVITTTKKDIIWNYIAIFFNMGAGVIVLPLILHFLSAEEIGLNYLMLTISSMVALIDFGFSPQIGRNVTYALSGAKRVEKEGLHEEVNSAPNYRLLATVIEAAKFIYKRMSVVALVLMLTLGTYYIHHVTHGFQDVSNSLCIWVVFCVSNYFNIYFIYYRSLLTGSGKIYESSVSIILSKVTYIVACGIMVSCGFGLISVVVANILAPLVLFAYSHLKFYTPQIKEKLPTDIKTEEIKNAISGIWYNAKRLGINSIGAFAILKLNLFFVGLYLPLPVVGSFGVLTQIVGVLGAVASAMFFSYVPQFSSMWVTCNYREITRKFSLTIVVYWITMIAEAIIMLTLLPYILSLIGSNVELPTITICVIYLIVMTLEGNHSLFASEIVTSNKVPFVEAGLIAGVIIAMLTFLSLKFTDLGLIGVVLSQGIVQLCYNNWRWPAFALNDLKVGPIRFTKEGVDEIIRVFKNIIAK